MVFLSRYVRKVIKTAKGPIEIKPQGKKVYEYDEQGGPRDKQPRRWPWLVIGVVGLVAMGGFWWYRKKFGAWPLEAKWKPVVNRLREIYTSVKNRL